MALPTELEICIRSWLPIIDQSEVEAWSAPLLPSFRSLGIFMARDPMVGDESGDAWLASVE